VAKAQFNDALTVSGGQLALSGPFTPESGLSPRASEAPLHIHWLVEQNGLVAEGLKQWPAGLGGSWNAEDTATRPWTAGPANAAAVILDVKTTSTGAKVVETFSWSQQVTLDVD
jgi:hypothetical protein